MVSTGTYASLHLAPDRYSHASTAPHHSDQLSRSLPGGRGLGLRRVFLGRLPVLQQVARAACFQLGDVIPRRAAGRPDDVRVELGRVVLGEHDGRRRPVEHGVR